MDIVYSHQEKRESLNTTLKRLEPIAKCSFSGKPADYYIGLSQSSEGASIKIVGAVYAEFVEMAINKLLGQGFEDVKWPVILNLNKELIYHSYHAHSKGLSAIFGWQEYLPKKQKSSV